MKNLCSPFALCEGFGFVNLPRMTARGQLLSVLVLVECAEALVGHIEVELGDAERRHRWS